MDSSHNKILRGAGVCPLLAHMGDIPLESGHNDKYEVTLLDALRILLFRKKVILAFAVVATLVGILYARSLPDVYQSEVSVILNKRGETGSTVSQDSNKILGSLFGTGPLAIGGNLNLYKAQLRSYSFAEYTVKSYNLIPLLAPGSNVGEQTYQQLETAANALIGGTQIADSKDLPDSMTITFSSHSPQLAAQVAQILVESINRYSQQDFITRAERDIALVNFKMETTTLTDIRDELFKITVQRTRDIVLAQAWDDYAFRVLDPPKIPKQKVKPRRTFIVLVFAFMGSLAGITAVFLYEVIKKNLLEKFPMSNSTGNYTT